MSSAGRLVEVALALPVFQTFAYAVPEALDGRVRRGARVVVPVRGRRQMGVCVGDADPARGSRRILSVADAPDAEPAIPEDVLQLCEWIADYYVTPLGMALRSALPVMMTSASAPAPRRRTRRLARLTNAVPTLMERDAMFGRAKKQREAYEHLESVGGSATIEHLREQLGVSPAVISGLASRGVVEIFEEEIDRDPFAARPRQPAPDLVPTAAQRDAIELLKAASPGEVFLLHGVTGSGKTLVYIELLRHVVHELGRTAIVLVPEIALTPQTVDRFRAVFGDQVAVLHSALGAGERYDAWMALRRGEKRIAVGARSAVFAPLPNLGAIVVDEEHETSYKQGEAPRYHAREVAIVRARAAGATVVLGSATPGLESWANAREGKFRLVSLPARVGGGSLPNIRIVDLRKTRGGNGARVPLYSRVVSDDLDAAIAERLARKEQVILLLNRRGYASFVQCGACGAVVVCPNCSITLTHHSAPDRLLCHYCGHHENAPPACPRCGGATLRQRGLGTQQVERLVAERFPSARITRMDVDTTSGKWAHATILDRVASGAVDILLGTQMIAKGLDFPNVTLVGVVDADVGINLPDFRASERCFQLLSQVAGRAGRGPKGGDVVIQTRVPQHHAVRYAVAHDYESFVDEETDARRQPLYPPHVRIANIVFSGVSQEGTAELAIDAGRWLRALVSRRRLKDVALIGPAPSPIERIQGRWRWHLALKSASPQVLSQVLRYFAERFEPPAAGQLRITIDRDPVSLL